jgi:predicted nucleotidyltransferase
LVFPSLPIFARATSGSSSPPCFTARMDEPTAAAVWRREAVQPVLDAYAAHAAVDAVMLSGSTARGDADRWSDVEIGVFWSRAPTAGERASVVHAADLRQVSRDDADPPWYDHVHLGAGRPDGLLVEVVHTTTACFESTLDTVLGACRPDPAGLDALKGLVDGRDVRGAKADLVTTWQERAATYPRELAIAVVRRDGAIEQFWRWRMLVERDNPLLIAREFMRVSSQLLNVLHALNGRYCGHASAFKRLDTLERELAVAPSGLAARIRSVFRLPVPEGAAALRALVEETYDLVELHLPEADADQLRALFRSDRRPLEKMTIR